jgi:pimeloyl-ACP methyl ester carboxylesterase
MSNLTSSEQPVVESTLSKYPWNWQGQTLTIAYETDGVGAPLLLLPSFSTVSSRTEMSELADNLSSQFQVTSLDFPGFGDSSRSRLDYAPPLYRQFLADFVRDIYGGVPVTIIAAGHAAGYALNLAATVPNRADLERAIADDGAGTKAVVKSGARTDSHADSRSIFVPTKYYAQFSQFYVSTTCLC